MSKLSGWLFMKLFPREYDHMRHLVDDVIRLEREKLGLKWPSTLGIVTGSNSKTFTTCWDWRKGLTLNGFAPPVKNSERLRTMRGLTT